MPITKNNRRLSSLRKGVQCSAADNLTLEDGDNLKSCTFVHQQKCKSCVKKSRSISMNNSKIPEVGELRFNLETRRFSCSDALNAHHNRNITHNRSRGLLLKNSEAVRRQKRSSKSKDAPTLSKEDNRLKLRNALCKEGKDRTKLIEVYGRKNVGKTTFLHLLKSLKEFVQGQQSSGVSCVNTNPDIYLTIENKEICPETISQEMDDVDACVVMFAVSDKASFQFAKLCVQNIRRSHREDVPIFLVANKSDLIRYRKVSTNDAIKVADVHKCLFFETALTMNHNTDELCKEVYMQTEQTSVRKQLKCFERVFEIFQSRMKRVFGR
ncbi:ras-related protein rapB-like [Saccostrea cucullata]|uniref:ras-related protein rapB-like n=1 Tax=Saccostrea cuccullata TaxID=36930 RepID=UPI002ED2AA27